MYWTKSPGTGGKVVTDDDFIVNEIPSKKFLAKYERKDGKVTAVTGPYFLYRLTKHGMTTKDAVNFVSRKFLTDVSFAGLKDKHAVTSQYITLKKKVEDFESDKISLRFISPCKNMMQVGELEGNSFIITLHGCKNPENAKGVINELSCMPNYFGPQRFGLHGNHDIGRLILKNNYEKALELINKNHPDNFFLTKDKKMIKFYINAYQSFVFNSVLEAYIERNSVPLFTGIPIVGFDTKLKNDFFGKETARILKRDNITTESFQLPDLSITCRGTTRPAFVKTKSISYEIKGDVITLCFGLPPGSYATVLVAEITKSDGKKTF